MNKYDNMLIHNTERSQAKVDLALKTIKKMLSNDEQVVVCELVKKTGLSRAFFYNNSLVHAEIERARGLQDGKSFLAPQKLVINKAMDREIALLKKKLNERDLMIEELRRENAKLKKSVESQALRALAEL